MTMHTNNYTTAYIYYATGHEDDADGYPMPEPCLYDYITDIEEDGPDEDTCLSLEALFAELLLEDTLDTPAFTNHD
jgi:hypothetical protein